MPGRLEFDVGFNSRGEIRPRPQNGDPLRILVIADLGSIGMQQDSLSERPVRAIDIDNFDKIMRTCAPGMGSAEASRIEFHDLDDFHPDQLYAKLRVFSAMRDLRKRLLDPATYDAAAAELLGDDGTENGAVTSTAPSAPEDMFERLLGAPAGSAPDAGDRGRSAIGALIADVVAPYVQRDIADRQAQLVATVDQGAGELMSLVLHARAFQQIESRWRSLHQLVSNFDAEEDARVYLYQATREELAGEFAAVPLQQTALYRRLVDRERDTAGGAPWSMIISDEYYGGDSDSLALLAQLGGLAAGGGGPLLAGADLALCGVADIAATPDAHDWPGPPPQLMADWQRLRAHPVAAHIGLGAPRVLARLPYGSRLEEVDAFDYEEMARGREHAFYLWANPAWSVARALAGELLDRPQLTIDDLPMHVYDAAGEREMQPCAEAWLSERTGQLLLDSGLMPLVSVKGRNAAQLMRLQSVAKPATALA